MKALVTKEDLDKYKYVADSIKNLTIWEQHVIEAQMLDVKTWLGDALLNEIITQADTVPIAISAANQTLLDGGSYVYQNNTYMFGGLKAAIIFYAFARFTSRSVYNYTQAGITVKVSEFSTPASDKAVQRLSTEALLTASAFKDEVVLFLRRNSSTYPLFKCSNSNGRPRTFLVIGD